MKHRTQGTSAAARLRFELMAAEYVERIGARIRERREALHLSRRDVVRRMDSRNSENDLYRWEIGKHRPSDGALESLAVALDVPVSYFFTSDTESEATSLRTPDLSFSSQMDRMEAKLDRLLEALLPAGEHAALAEELASSLDEAVREHEERTSEDEAARPSTG